MPITLSQGLRTLLRVSRAPSDAGPVYAVSMLMFSTNSLFASLIWGSAGVGYFIFGKKQRSWVPMVGGVVMTFVSYAVGSALLMTVICVGIMTAVYFLLKRGC